MDVLCTVRRVRDGRVSRKGIRHAMQSCGCEEEVV